MTRRDLRSARPARLALPAALGAVLPAVPGFAGEGEEGGAPKYPPTRREDVTTDLHGERIPDPYRWLENDDFADVAAWDGAQEAYLRTRLDAFPRRAEIGARLSKEMDLPGIRDLPHFEGGRMWFRERPEGKNHSVLYSLPEDGGGTPAVVIDPNLWAADGTESLRDFFPSPDAKWLAYTRDSRGSENSVLHLRDLATGQDVPLTVTRMKFTSFLWAPDSKGFYYSRNPDPESVPSGEEQYHRRVLYHPLDGLLLDDEVLYGKGRPKIEDMWLDRSFDREHVFVVRGIPYKSHDTFELEWVDGKRVLTPILDGQDSITWVDRVGDAYLLNTDWKAPRRRLCVAKRGETHDASKWTTILPEGLGVIEYAAVVRGPAPAAPAVLVHVREDVTSRLRVIGLDGADKGQVTLPGPGTVREVSTKPSDTRVWFTFESYDRPPTNYVVDLAELGRAPQALQTSPTSVDVAALVTERLTYPSKDGTKIPLFVLRRKDVPLDGRAPTVLYGYGGFRVGMYPYYSGSGAIWAEMGGVLAVACLRGGDEFGEDWHQAGCLAKKQNVFDDFIAAAEWLVAEGKAKRERLAIRGGSNGGLLVATCVNQRPDLCRAAVCEVPLTDMLRFHRFQYALEWTKEYGNPDVAEEFAWIRPYSPYHNVKAGTAYPAVFVTAGLHDGRVNAFHARKIVAQWQAATTSKDRPVLLHLDRSSGHGAASRKQAEEEILDRFCFLLQELGGA